MAEGGKGLSTRARAARRRQAVAAAERETRAARLGVSLRSVLVSPASGFGSYFREIEARPGAGRATSILLGALLGASSWLLWLKVNGLFALRPTTCTFRWSYLIGAIVAGAISGMVSQVVWGAGGAFAAKQMGGTGSPARLRLAWGAASIPHAGALLILLPLDLLIAGSDAYRAIESEGAGATAWRALSVAVATSLLVWSLWILYRGTGEATGLDARQAGSLVVLAGACLALPIVLLVIAASGGSSCPT